MTITTKPASRFAWTTHPLEYVVEADGAQQISLAGVPDTVDATLGRFGSADGRVTAKLTVSLKPGFGFA